MLLVSGYPTGVFVEVYRLKTVSVSISPNVSYLLLLITWLFFLHVAIVFKSFVKIAISELGYFISLKMSWLFDKIMLFSNL